MNSAIKYPIAAKRAFVFWALITIALITCPLKKAVKAYQNISPVSHSYSGVYTSCAYERTVERRSSACSEKADPAPRLFDVNWNNYWQVADKRQLHFSRFFSEGLSARLPLFLQYRKILL